jgi:hypothetical protein
MFEFNQALYDINPNQQPGHPSKNRVLWYNSGVAGSGVAAVGQPLQFPDGDARSAEGLPLCSVFGRCARTLILKSFSGSLLVPLSWGSPIV